MRGWLPPLLASETCDALCCHPAGHGGAGYAADKEVDDDRTEGSLDRRHLPNLQAQRMLAFPVLASEADGAMT